MARGDEPVDLRRVLRRTRSRPAGSGAAESRLDSLLEEHSRSQVPEACEVTDGASPSPLDRLRRRFETELIPVFEDLRHKYEASGVNLVLDADNFLRGGRDIRIVIEFGGAGMRFDGTAMPNSIAFQQTRYAMDDPGGLTASGPTLRTRDLNSERFRSFVCDRIMALIQSVVPRKA